MGDGGETGGNRRERFWRVIGRVAIASYLLVAFVLALAIPLGGAPDEPAHLAYVGSIAAHGRLPMLAELGTVDAQGRVCTPEAQQPPLYYVLMAPVHLLASGNPRWVFAGGRLMSIIMCLLAVLLARRAVRTLMPDRPDVVAMGTVFACTFNTYCYIAGTLNNEALAILLVATGLYFSARVLVAEEPLRPMAILGVVLGLGLLTKLTTSVLIGPIVAAGLGVAMRSEGRRERALEAAKLLGVAFGAALIVAGWWYMRNLMAHGHLAQRADYRPLYYSIYDFIALPELSVALMCANAEELLRSIWAPNWLMRPPVPPSVVWTAHMVGGRADLDQPFLTLRPLIPLLVVGWGVVRAWRDRTEAGLSGRQRWFFGGLVAAGVVLLTGIEIQMLYVDSHIYLFAGRYLPVLLPGLGMAMGLGMMSLTPKIWRRRVAVGVLVVTVLYCLWVTQRVAVMHGGTHF